MLISKPNDHSDDALFAKCSLVRFSLRESQRNLIRFRISVMSCSEDWWLLRYDSTGRQVMNVMAFGGTRLEWNQRDEPIWTEFCSHSRFAATTNSNVSHGNHLATVIRPLICRFSTNQHEITEFHLKTETFVSSSCRLACVQRRKPVNVAKSQIPIVKIEDNTLGQTGWAAHSRVVQFN